MVASKKGGQEGRARKVVIAVFHDKSRGWVFLSPWIMDNKCSEYGQGLRYIYTPLPYVKQYGRAKMSLL